MEEDALRKHELLYVSACLRIMTRATYFHHGGEYMFSNFVVLGSRVELGFCAVVKD